METTINQLIGIYNTVSGTKNHNLFAPNSNHVNALLLKRMCCFLNRNLNTRIGVECLAKEMAMSKSTLNRKLKLIVGTSANDFIRQYRLQKAVELIASGYGIAQAAYKVGFESPSYFTQCFKEVYNLKPTDYQKTYC